MNTFIKTHVRLVAVFLLMLAALPSLAQGRCRVWYLTRTANL